MENRMSGLLHVLDELVAHGLIKDFDIKNKSLEDIYIDLIK